MTNPYRRISRVTMLLFGGIIFLSTFSDSRAESRWYDQALVEKGKSLFLQNCASCHGLDASGTADWKKTDANGNFPPPPLNGTGHAWHHSISVFKTTIRQGGIRLGGTMPPFEAILNDSDMDAIISFFQSKWSDEIYEGWERRYPSTETQSMAPAEESNSQPDTQAAEMTALLKQRLGGQNISPPVESPIDGIYYVSFGTKFGYLIEDGRYLLMGNLIDLKNGINLTERELGKAVVTELGKVALSDRIIYPAFGEEKAILSVFTDTSCPYCQKMHLELPKLQEAGISVHYLPYPRGSTQGPGYQSLRQVWCAKDRANAMTIAKRNRGKASAKLPAGDCPGADMVDRGYQIGNKVGVTGTPSLFKSNGEKIIGYVPYKDLIPRVVGNL